MTTPIVGTDDAGLAQSVACVLRGGLLVYPTETVYGLGGDPTNKQLIRRIQKLKGREEGDPFLVLTDSWERLSKWIGITTQVHERLMQHRPRLPITILFPATDQAPRWMVGADGLVGIRRTSDPFCLSLIGGAGVAIASTSANRSGDVTPKSFAEIDGLLLNAADLAVKVEGDLTGKASTVVRVGGETVRIVREGAVAAQTIREIIG